MAEAVRFPGFMTLAAARAAFFEASGLGPGGGYEDRWVRVESRPVPFFFPNTRCRVAAAKLHDLHHIAMEYWVDWTGEAEIAGWEIASGCGRYGWAWLLNLGAFTVGLVRSPRRLFRAFLNGRSVRSNLYHDFTGFAESDLPRKTVHDLRRRLGLLGSPPAAPARVADILAFGAWAFAGVAWHLLMAAIPLAALWLALRALGVL